MKNDGLGGVVFIYFINSEIKILQKTNEINPAGFGDDCKF